MIRDQLVCGVYDHAIQRHLLAESILDLKKAMEIDGDKEFPQGAKQEAAIEFQGH